MVDGSKLIGLENLLVRKVKWFMLSTTFEEYVANTSVLTSAAVFRLSGLSNSNSFRDRW